VPVFKAREITVGVGHNLIRGPYPIKARYTDKEIDSFYNADYDHALRAAREGVYEFDSLPKQARFTCLSVIWCVGPTGFMCFSRLRANLDLQLYGRAAYELNHSKWATQVGRRRLHNHLVMLEVLDIQHDR